MVSSMTKGEVKRFTRFCEDQGIGVTRTKKGLLLRFPDGSSSTQHFTNSDVRAEANQIARFRRAGMVHPNDTREQSESLPSYITDGSVTQKTRERIVKYVTDKGFPEFVLAGSVVRDLGVDPVWANRALYHSGFRPGKARNRKIGRPWYTPDSILDMQEGREEVPGGEKSPKEVNVVATEEKENRDLGVVEAAREFLDSKEPLPSLDFVKKTGHEGEHLHLRNPDVEQKPDVEQEESPIDFIDERDSWVVDMEKLFGENIYRIMIQKLSVLDVVGMEYEMRIWRK